MASLIIFIFSIGSLMGFFIGFGFGADIGIKIGKNERGIYENNNQKGN